MRIPHAMDWWTAAENQTKLAWCWIGGLCSNIGQKLWVMASILALLKTQMDFLLCRTKGKWDRGRVGMYHIKRCHSFPCTSFRKSLFSWHGKKPPLPATDWGHREFLSNNTSFCNCPLPGSPAFLAPALSGRQSHHLFPFLFSSSDDNHFHPFYSLLASTSPDGSFKLALILPPL